MNQRRTLQQLDEYTTRAVSHYWQMRASQRRKQEQSGKADQGLRSAVTGGAQMDGFIDLFTALITEAGIPEQFIFRKKTVELPGYFRPTKEWDLLVVKERQLIAAIEAKSSGVLGSPIRRLLSRAQSFPVVRQWVFLPVLLFSVIRLSTFAAVSLSSVSVAAAPVTHQDRGI